MTNSGARNNPPSEGRESLHNKSAKMSQLKLMRKMALPQFRRRKKQNFKCLWLGLSGDRLAANQLLLLLAIFPEVLFHQIELEKVSTSMTINSTAAILLALYMLVAKRQGADPKKLQGTIQNDMLKEYVARGTYIYPPRAAMRIITDLFSWAQKEMPEWNTISISGYHIREAGSTAVQEVAFTMANAIAYIEAAIKAGMNVDSFAPRLSFFFNSHNNFLEEIAKFRAARRIYAKTMRHRFGAKDSKSMMLRFHAQTAGSTLTAQQPDVNLVRVTMQALAAVLGGAQSLHTNSKDEALGLPTEESARLALRTQQIIAYESGVTSEPDPLGGSEHIERLTDEIEAAAQLYLDRIDGMGGALAAIEAVHSIRDTRCSLCSAKGH